MPWLVAINFLYASIIQIRTLQNTNYNVIQIDLFKTAQLLTDERAFQYNNTFLRSSFKYIRRVM
jgi:hypothetical protein